MKRFLLILALLVTLPAFAACGTTTTFDWQHSSGISGSINTTGATLLIIGEFSWMDGQSNSALPSDSAGNVWQYGPSFGVSGSTTIALTFFFVPNPTTSATHTFTSTGTFPSGVVFSCTGTATSNPFASANGLSPISVFSAQPGSVTPLEAGDLIISCLGANGVAFAATLDSGFSATTQTANVGTTCATLIAPDTSAVNPTWTIGAGARCDGTSGSKPCTLGIAVFKAAGATPLTASGYSISTVAGTGGLGFSGDGAAATLAKLNWPGGIATDPSGNLYIPVVNDNRIRVLNQQSTTQTFFGVSICAGCIKTVAGTGALGFSGDGGPALSATMAHPSAVALDASLNLFFADQQNNRVRRIDAITGIITTVVGSGLLGSGGCGAGGGGTFTGDGGPATSATLTCPQAVAFDTAGNMYIGDTNNNRVRVVNNQSTTQTILNQSVCSLCIKTVAGNGTGNYSGDAGQAISAGVHWPISMVIDPTGIMYIADFSNNRVRKVLTSGVISTFAGNGTAGYSGDAGLATSAMISAPYAVALSRGLLYIVEGGNNVIRVVYPNGNIGTEAGNYALSPNSSSTWLSGGYIGDSGPAVNALLNNPIGIAFDSVGNYYVGDLFNNRVRKVTLSSGSSISGGITASGGVSLR